MTDWDFVLCVFDLKVDRFDIVNISLLLLLNMNNTAL